MTSVNYCCIVSHFSLEKKTKQSLVKQKLRSAFMLKHSPVIKIYKGIEYQQKVMPFYQISQQMSCDTNWF